MAIDCIVLIFGASMCANRAVFDVAIATLVDTVGLTDFTNMTVLHYYKQYLC